jgi:hypothetical protein
MDTSKLSAGKKCIVSFAHEPPCMCRQRQIAAPEERCMSFGLAHNPADWLLKGAMMDLTQTRSQVNCPFQELQTPFLVLTYYSGQLGYPDGRQVTGLHCNVVRIRGSPV